MRACVQRVQSASVTIREPQPVVAGNIEQGLLVFLGVGQGDTENDARLLAKKIAELRIFEDTAGKMNLSLLDVGGSMLVVSQFSLYADCRKGRRPSFTAAAKPDEAERLYKIFCEAVRGQGITVETGVFRTEMQVALVNDGPVTIWMDTAEWKTHPLAF